MKKNINYDCSKNGSTDREIKRMGEEGYAGLPTSPIMRDFPKSTDYRGGNLNSAVSSLIDLSDIEENR